MEQLENLSYDEYRAIAQDGDIIFLRGAKRSPIQALIMFATGSLYCHVAIAFWVEINGQKRLMVVESQGNTRRRILSASYYRDRKMDIVRAVKPWTAIADDALSQVGIARYGYLDAIWVGIREFAWNKFHLRLPYLNESRGEICSEFVARMEGIEPVSISPGALYKTLKG